MKTKTIKIEADVEAVLRRSEITETLLKLPDQLPRDLYVRVDKILKAHGGKWNRKLGGHVFETDPRQKFASSLEAGAAVDEKKSFDIYYTPEKIALELARGLGLRHGDRVLEPEAGSGALVRALKQAQPGCVVHACEIRTNEFSSLTAAGADTIEVGDDFLEKPVPESELGLFDAVLMNPPFSGGQDVAHVRHALRFVKPGGTLVAIMPPGWRHNSARKFTEFKEFVADLNGRWRDLPDGSFEEAGTSVRTGVLTIRTALLPRAEATCHYCGRRITTWRNDDAGNVACTDSTACWTAKEASRVS